MAAALIDGMKHLGYNEPKSRGDEMEPFTWWDRLKAEFKDFTSYAGGKMMIFMLVLGIICVIIVFWALSLF